MATTPAEKTSAAGPGLKRSLSVWSAVGLSLALMAPSMAANINPQGRAGPGGRCRWRSSSPRWECCSSRTRSCGCASTTGTPGRRTRSSGATLGPRAGVVAGWGLVGTYTFYAVTTAGAAGVFGSGLFDSLGLWKNQPSWSPILFVGVALALALLLAALPAKGGTNVLLVVETLTVALILVVTVTVLVKVIGHTAPGGAHFTMSVFSLSPGTSVSALFLGVVFGFLSFAGFEASATLGEEARRRRGTSRGRSLASRSSAACTSWS